MKSLVSTQIGSEPSDMRLQPFAAARAERELGEKRWLAGCLLMTMSTLGCHTCQMLANFQFAMMMVHALALHSKAANSLGGAAPLELALLSDLLEALKLGCASVAGALPAELGLLMSLYFLQLWEENLSGAAPTELGQLSLLGSWGSVLSAPDSSLAGAAKAEFFWREKP